MRSNNKMVGVAELLGITMGEPFIIQSNLPDLNNPYTLTLDGLYDSRNRQVQHILTLLLSGVFEIKAVFKPEQGQLFQYITKQGCPITTNFDYSNIFCIMCLKLGNCFTTKQPIPKEDIIRFCKFFDSDTVFEVL